MDEAIADVETAARAKNEIEAKIAAEKGERDEGWTDVAKLPRALIFGDGTTAEIDVSVTLKSSGQVIPVKYGSGYFYADKEDPKTGKTVTCDYTPDVKNWRLR